MTRIDRIRAALSSLAPVRLVIEDESHQHAGHAGAATGRGHFHVDITSAAFTGLAPVARHRKVYEALGSLMQTDIHALRLTTKAPAEA